MTPACLVGTTSRLIAGWFAEYSFGCFGCTFILALCRTYSKKTQLAQWQTDMNYCDTQVKTRKQYAHGRRLLDLVDLHIMDYLIVRE